MRHFHPRQSMAAPHDPHGPALFYSVKATPQSAAEAWQTGFGGAATKYEAGINAVTVAPGALAAQQQAAYVAGVQNNAKIWAAKVGAVDLATWKAAATGVGSSRLSSGATKGLPKVQSFMQGFLPALTSIVGSLPNRGTFEQNMARSMSYAQALHARKGSF